VYNNERRGFNYKSNVGKMKKTIGIVIIGTAITALVAFGAWYFLKQFKMLSDYCYKFWKGRINSMGLKKIDLTLYFIIFNKSSADITITEQSYVAKANGEPITNIYSNKEIYIKAYDKSVINVNISFNPLQVLKIALTNLSDILVNRSNISIEVDGYASAGTGGLVLRRIPITYTTTLAELTEEDDTPESEITC